MKEYINITIHGMQEEDVVKSGTRNLRKSFQFIIFLCNLNDTQFDKIIKYAYAMILACFADHFSSHMQYGCCLPSSADIHMPMIMT